MNHPQSTFQLPGQWSTFAHSTDETYYFIYWMSVAFFVGITGAALYFVWKYRRRPGVKAEPTGHNLPLEVAWTIAPVFLLALLFHRGFVGYIDLTVPPANALDIRVRARKWSWDFEYPNGAHTVNELHVPVHRPVRLILSSEDVIHAMYIPGFRVKRDAVPGSYETEWFEATDTGRIPFACAEYCGAAGNIPAIVDGHPQYSGHFSMGGSVIIQTPVEFQHFLDAGIGPHPGESTVAYGARMYHENQCFTCHSTNGSPMTGPTWQHLWGRHENLEGGTSITVDENYIRESILNPQAKIVRGFQPVMPTFRGTLNDRQIDAIIAYIRTL